jgi:hypothetical protein
MTSNLSLSSMPLLILFKKLHSPPLVVLTKEINLNYLLLVLLKKSAGNRLMFLLFKMKGLGVKFVIYFRFFSFDFEVSSFELLVLSVIGLYRARFRILNYPLHPLYRYRMLGTSDFPQLFQLSLIFIYIKISYY